MYRIKLIGLSVLLLINQISCSFLDDYAKRLDRFLACHHFRETDLLLSSSPDILQTLCTSQVISRCLDLRNYNPIVQDHGFRDIRVRRSIFDSSRMESESAETISVRTEGTRILFLLLPYASKTVLTRALNSAIFHRDDEFIDSLLRDHPLSFFEADEEGTSPLMMAVKFHRQKWFYWLVEHGANLSYINYRGENIVHFIAKSSIRDKALVSFIFFGTDVNQSDLTVKNNQGRTPLELAISSGNQVVIDLLQNIELLPN